MGIPGSTSFQEFHKELVRVVRDGVHCLHRGELVGAMPGAVGFLLLAEFHAVHDAGGRFLLRDWLHAVHDAEYYLTHDCLHTMHGGERLLLIIYCVLVRVGFCVTLI